MSSFPESAALAKLHIVGDIFCDIIVSDSDDMLPIWGIDMLANIKILPGGSALNSAIHAANFAAYKQNNIKLEISLFGSTGTDVQGAICDAALLNYFPILKNNVLKIPDKRTGTCIVITGSQDRCFVSDRGCLRDMSLTLFSRDHVLSSNHIHIGGFYNLDKMQSEVLPFFQIAYSLGKTTSLTAQYDATGKWGFVVAICPYLTFLICNEMELKFITSRDNVSEAAKYLLDSGCKYVIATKGKDGVDAYHLMPSISIDEPLTMVCTHEPIPAVVTVMDSTGAGDAFVGGFLIEWLHSGCLEPALRAGCLCGTAAVTVLGGSTSSFEALKAVDDLRKKNVIPLSLTLPLPLNGEI